MIKHIFQRTDGTFREVTHLVEPYPDPAPDPGETLRFNGLPENRPQALLDEIMAANPISPNGTGFRTAIAQAASYQNWVDSLPQHCAISLAIAAANDNWTEVQGIYNAAVAITPPASGARAEWQAIATANHIHLDFGSD